MAKETPIEGTHTTLIQGEAPSMTMEDFQQSMAARIKLALDEPVGKIIQDDFEDPLEMKRTMARGEQGIEKEFEELALRGLRSAWNKARIDQDGDA